jgi:hypothetical protein
MNHNMNHSLDKFNQALAKGRTEENYMTVEENYMYPHRSSPNRNPPLVEGSHRSSPNRNPPLVEGPMIEGSHCSSPPRIPGSAGSPSFTYHTNNSDGSSTSHSDDSDNRRSALTGKRTRIGILRYKSNRVGVRRSRGRERGLVF